MFESELDERHPTMVAGAGPGSMAGVDAGRGRGRCRVAAAVAAVLAAMVLVIASVVPAGAAPVFTVIDPTDAPDANLNGQCASTYLGLCTLRAAIQEAEFAGGGEVVLSAGIGDYQLTIPAGAEGNTTGNNAPSNLTGDLDITTSVTVTGSGPEVSVIDGMGAVRIFDVHANSFLRVRGVTLQNGSGDYDSATGHRHGGASTTTAPSAWTTLPSCAAPPPRRAGAVAASRTPATAPRSCRT